MKKVVVQSFLVTGVLLAVACSEQGFKGRNGDGGVPGASSPQEEDTGDRSRNKGDAVGQEMGEPGEDTNTSGAGTDALAQDSAAAQPTPVPSGTQAAGLQPTQGPVVEPSVAPVGNVAVLGEWRGFCGHWHDAPLVCTHGVVPPMTANGTCPSGTTRVHVGARLQLGDNDARTEAWSAACVTSGTPSAEQLQNLSAKARAGGVYGLCVYTHNSSSCDVNTLFPMQANKTCPAGFVFTHMGARYQGRNELWYAACVAQNDGPQVERVQGAWTGVCAYPYNSNACSKAAVGGIIQRGQCPQGTFWRPFVARWNGLNETWVGTCVRN